VNEKIPVCFPVEVQESTGVYIHHVPVYTTRLVMQEMDEEGGVFSALGTISSVLCLLPLRLKVIRTQHHHYHVFSNSYGGLHGFRSMCQMIRDQVLPTAAAANATRYSKLQWCIAVLKKGSTLDCGRCTLISPAKGDGLSTRVVEDSLLEDMRRMGIVCEEMKPLPPYVNESNRNMVTLERVVDNHLVSYRSTDATNNALLLDSVCTLPSQSFDVHRMASWDSQGLFEMRDGFRRVWDRSFHIHDCYHVCDGQMMGKMI
jgi:bacterioferritin-associated ferredoxin